MTPDNSNTAKRLTDIQRAISQLEKRAELTAPLLHLLRGIAYHMDMHNIPRTGRRAKLIKSAWPEQYEAKIERVMGFDIIWIDDGQEDTTI